MQNDRLTLRQLNLMVQDAIEMQLPDEYWVEAELSECRERSGHCYMELIEKDEQTNSGTGLCQMLETDVADGQPLFRTHYRTTAPCRAESAS